MAFRVPTLDEMTDLLVRDFGNRFPDADTARSSDNWKRLRVLALAATSLHRHAVQIDRDIMPDTASGVRLERWGSIIDVPRKGATPAKKSDALRVTGIPGAAVTLGDELTSDQGLRFQVNETSVVGVLGYVDVDVLGIDAGSQTRLSVGAALTFVSAPTGVDATATLIEALDEDGEDQEEEGAYRDRILDKFAQPEAGGKPEDYRKWAREVDVVDEAYVWPTRGGLGTVHLAALKTGEGSARLLNPTEIAEVQAHIDEERPTAYLDSTVLTVVADPQNVEVAYVPESSDAYRPDWDDTDGWTVTAWTAGTRTLQLSADRPADMQIGDRLVYQATATPWNTGEEMVIEAFGAGDDEVVLAEHDDLTAAPPVIGNPVYAGGPLVEPIRQAIKDHINSLGPTREDTLAGEDFSEGGTYWEGTLRPTKLLAVAQSVEGVRDSEVITPAANYSPTNEAPATTVGLVTPQQIIARRL